jgi:hypothetical protein
MATRIVGIAATDGIQVAGGDVVFAASGGTLDASNVVQLNFNDSVFGASMEGKQRLLAAIDVIKARVASAKVWPVTSSS